MELLNRPIGVQSNTRRTKLAIVSVALAVYAASCTPAFTNCEDTRSCPRPETDAGVGGEPGQDDGQGGTTSRGGTQSAAGAVGEGGTAGAAETAGSASGGRQQEENPTAGAAGSAEMEEPCAEDERSCGDVGSAQVRVCHNGKLSTELCDSGTVCAGSDASCKPAASGCETRRPGEAFCDAGERIECSADRLSTKREMCAGTCDGGTCVSPTCGDSKVQADEECDDGNTDEADGCTSKCKWGPKDVVAGGHSTCAMFGNGAVKCWGDNTYGQLGMGDTDNRGDNTNEMGANLPFVQIAGKTGIFSSISMGGYSACWVSDGGIWCSGSNGGGVLGQGNTVNYSTLQPVDVGGRAQYVRVGENAICALLETGDAKCWGSAAYIGLGDDKNYGDDPGEMGKNLPKVDIGGTATIVESQYANACVELSSGAIKCWGSNLAGQLGLPPSGFDTVTHPLTIDWGTPMPQQISVGYYFMCALQSGDVKCWGWNDWGQLGQGSTDAQGQPKALGVVPVGTSADPVVQVGAGNTGTCALLKSGGVKCWGSAEHGFVAQPALVTKLGDIGDSPGEVEQLTPIDFGRGKAARKLSVGQFHACALINNGEIKCWGLNDAGQLGLGHKNDIGDDAAELGDTMQSTIIE